MNDPRLDLYARKFFTTENAASYDLLAFIATFGEDRQWKRQIIKRVKKDNGLMLDLACGTGILTSMLDKEDCSKRLVGLDLTFEYLRLAREKLQSALLVNGTAEILPYKSDSFDSIVSSYLPKYVNIGILLDECWRVLRGDGILVLHDFVYPVNELVQRIWKSYFNFLSLIASFVKKWQNVFRELDQVVENSGWVKQTIDFLHLKGFTDISCTYYTLGTAAIISAKKP
jgi:demethylmenaquinone methyltransferase / 2-methoxy-6-polyprenyl-1,4-benzoquinol methylase